MSENEWKMLKEHIRNEHAKEYHGISNELTVFLIWHKFSDEQKKFLLEIYHNNYAYIQYNITIALDHDPLFQEMCFVIAISFSPDIQMIKFLIDKFEINKNNGHNEWHCLMINGFKFNPNLQVSEFIIKDLEFDIKYIDKRCNYFKRALSENSNIEVVKFLTTGLHLDVILHTPGYEEKNILVNMIQSYNETMNMEELAKRHKKYLQIIIHLLEHTNILSKIDFQLLIGNFWFNFDLAKKYILSIKNYSLLQKFIKEMYKYNCKGTYINKEKYQHVIDIIKIVYKHNSLMLCDEICEYAKLKSPFEENFGTFVSLANKLTHKVPIREKKIVEIESHQVQKAKRLRHDFSGQVPLFTHYENNYKANQNVIDSILMFKEISNCCEIKDIELSINVPKYIVNLYILSSYTGRFCIDDIDTNDLIDFLKFIEAYETVYLSPSLIEDDLIDYFEKNNFQVNEYLMNMCIRYKLKNMYLYFKNKNLLE